MSESLGTLHVGRTAFDVKEAVLSVRFRRDTALEWLVDVQTAEGEDGDAPRAYLERYTCRARTMDEFLASPIVIADGAEFCGHRILPCERLCCLYMGLHDYLDHNRIEFRRHEGNRLRMRWAGRWRLVDDDQIPLALTVETIVDFAGFFVDVEDEREARKLLAERFEPRGLQYEKTSGGSFFLPIPGAW